VHPGWAASAVALAVWLGGALSRADAHVVVVPAEGPPSVVQRYALLIPTEKASPTTRIEIQFPAGLRVSEIEAVSGWRSTAQRDRAGRIVGAIWEGGQLPAGHFLAVGVLARNPDAPGEMLWKLIQTHQDGSEIHWIGPPSAEFPAAVTVVRRLGEPIGLTTILAGVALIGALLAVAVALLSWRRAAP
jgi:uncharacterized protein YcnI